jgi:hypothetical protein
MRLEFSQQICEEYSAVKFNENPFSGSGFVQCGRTDGQRNDHGYNDSHFPEFCERA